MWKICSAHWNIEGNIEGKKGCVTPCHKCSVVPNKTRQGRLVCYAKRVLWSRFASIQRCHVVPHCNLSRPIYWPSALPTGTNDLSYSMCCAAISTQSPCPCKGCQATVGGNNLGRNRVTHHAVSLSSESWECLSGTCDKGQVQGRMPMAIQPKLWEDLPAHCMIQLPSYFCPPGKQQLALSTWIASMLHVLCFSDSNFAIWICQEPSRPPRQADPTSKWRGAYDVS